MTLGLSVNPFSASQQHSLQHWCFGCKLFKSMAHLYQIGFTFFSPMWKFALSANQHRKHNQCSKNCCDTSKCWITSQQVRWTVPLPPSAVGFERLFRGLWIFPLLVWVLGKVDLEGVKHQASQVRHTCGRHLTPCLTVQLLPCAKRCSTSPEQGEKVR